MRQPGWVLGIVGVAAAALFQALALFNGPIALVQPVFVLELPFALVIGGALLNRRLPRDGWYGVIVVVFGLALLLAAANPRGNETQAAMVQWIPALDRLLRADGRGRGHRPDPRCSSLMRAAVLGTPPPWATR